MHGNCVATYVPWLIHEPEEGEILWGDIDNRDLCAFLELCQKLSLNVILRPGPMQYSELNYGGLARWLIRDYPQVRAQKIDGSYQGNISYMHPILLEKARKYFSAFAAVTKKYMKKNGGPVSVLQVDNELFGMHVWHDTLDYNRETYGFGREDGSYALYLKRIYGDIKSLNDAYNSQYTSFGEVFPSRCIKDDIYACRSARDYCNFYLEQGGVYIKTLASWLREDGIEEIVCHNSANPNMNSLFERVVEMQESGFLLGSDHYYNLHQDMKQNNPTPQYALEVLFSCEQLRNMCMPPTVFELPAGSCSDFPPILSEDLYACYASSVALGMKGMNFYIFTGGPNLPGTGSTADVYDYNALIRADGKINDTYYATKKICGWLTENPWMESAERLTSVNVAYENELFRSEYFGYCAVKMPQHDTVRFIRNGILYSLMAAEYAPSLVDISKSIPDTDKPLILCASSILSRKSQENVVSFLKAGGKLIVMPTLPEMDECYNECTILRDYIGIDEVDDAVESSVVMEGCKETIYDLRAKSYIAETENEGEKVVNIIGRTKGTQKAVIAEKSIGSGKVIFGTFSYILKLQSQVDMIRNMLQRFDADSVVFHSNPHVFVSYFKGKNDEKALFIMNLYSSRNKTDIMVDGKKSRI